MRKALLAALCALLLGAVGCVSEEDAPTTTGRAVDLTTTSTTPSTTATTSPTTSTPATTVVPTTSTTSTSTTLADAPVIHLAGSSVMYSATGSVHVEGRSDRRVDVMIGGVAATVSPVEAGPTIFSADLALDPGVHVIAVTAADRSTGTRTTQFLTVIVDPSLEEQFAYLYIIGGSVVADYAEWFTGDEATQAAREDGALPPQQPEEEGFYIRNLDPSTQVVTLADNPVIVLWACYEMPLPCLTREAVDAQTWADLMADPEVDYDLVGWWWYGDGYLPYWLTIDDGVVVQVTEHYLP
ncbi:MAG: hypothetical protein ABIJ48_10330 [Actinomycetota bacterium]